MTSECDTMEERLKLYKDVAKGLLGKLTAYEIIHVPRPENKEADLLSKLALGDLADHLSLACRMEVVERPSTEMLLVYQVTSAPSAHSNPITHPEWFWIANILRYKDKCELLNNKEEADLVRRITSSYMVVDGQLCNTPKFINSKNYYL